MNEPRKLLRQIDTLNESDLLWLHREVCRRASKVYAPMYRAKWEANYPVGVAAARSKRRT